MVVAASPKGDAAVCGLLFLVYGLWLSVRARRVMQVFMVYSLLLSVRAQRAKQVFEIKKALHEKYCFLLWIEFIIGGRFICAGECSRR
jgi:hypothetical protein